MKQPVPNRIGAYRCRSPQGERGLKPIVPHQERFIRRVAPRKGSVG